MLPCAYTRRGRSAAGGPVWHRGGGGLRRTRLLGLATHRQTPRWRASSALRSSSPPPVAEWAQDQGQARGATRRPSRRTIPGGRLQIGDDREARRSTFASTATGGQRRLPPPRQQAGPQPHGAAFGCPAVAAGLRCPVPSCARVPLCATSRPARPFSHAPSSSVDPSTHAAPQDTPQLLPTSNSARRLGA